jgi:hypothetical protein
MRQTPMIRITTVIWGSLELLRLGWITRFRLKGRYWSWRMHTAMGDGPKPGRGEMIRLILEYAAWARRMRRG